MKRTGWLLLLMLLWHGAQAIELVVVQNVEEAGALGYHLQYRLAGTDNLDEIRQPGDDDGLWRLSHGAELNLGFEPRPVWLRVRLLNRSPQTVMRWLEINNALLDEVDVHIIRDSGSVQSFVAGDTRPFAVRPIARRLPTFPLELPANTAADVYIRIATAGSLSVPVRLRTPSALVASDGSVNLAQGLFYGALLIMLAFNVLVFLELKEKSYLYLVGFVASLMIYLAALQGYAFQYVWPQWPWWQERAVAVLLALLTSASGLFTNTFMSPSERMRKAVQVLTIAAAVLAVAALFLSYQWSIRLAMVLVAFTTVAVTWVSVRTWTYGVRSERLMATGWFVFILGVVVNWAGRAGLLPEAQWTEVGVQTGVILEILLLSVAFIGRLAEADELRDQARRQALLVQEQANKELEMKVEERTAELHEALAKLSELNQRLRLTSSLDALTQIHNRAAFDETMANQWKHASRSKSPLSLIFLDIDHFKRLNDRYGHDVGDECLKLVARAIKEQVVRDTDFVARYGGEEFVVLLPHTGERDAAVVAERIRKAVARLEPCFKGVQLSITLSAGVATCRWQREESPKDLLKMADLALYKAKREGRNRVVLADEQMRTQLKEM
jgi:diguanylate cyclase